MAKVRNIYKQPATMEDLAQGVGTTEQRRAGQLVTAHKIDVPLSVNSEAELQVIDAIQFTQARVYSSVSEYIDYVYDPAATAGISPTDPATPGFWVEKINALVTTKLEATILDEEITSLGVHLNSLGVHLNSVEYKDTPTSVNNPTVRPPKEPVFAFHFDGPYIANFTTLLDKADELGVKVGIGSINDLTNGAFGGKSGDSNFGSVEDLINASNRGHEIYNHGFSSGLDMSPGTNVPEDLQNFWVNYSHTWLESLGINAQMWVTSNGGGISDQTAHLDPKYIPKILEKHSVAFGRTSSIGNDINGYQGVSYGADTLVNKEGLTRANIEGQNITAIKAFIDWCIENNRVAIFHAHDAGNSGQVDVAKFEEIVNYIHSKNIKVVKSQELFASFTNLFSDDGTTSKAANNTALDVKSVVQENLLPTTDLTQWTRAVQSGMGATSLTNYSVGRDSGEQLQLVVATPTVVNRTFNLSRVINRPFNRNDVATLCLSIETQTNDSNAFGINCIVQFYSGENATGSVVYTFNEGKVVNSNIIFDVNSAVGFNGFAYSSVQSVKLTYEIANKTTWTGNKALNLFNPTFNRGNAPSVFFKTGVSGRTVIWKGHVGDVGVINLYESAYGYEYIKVEVGVNNVNNDVRGSELFAYNTHDNRTIRAWSSGGVIYTDFVVRFTSPTTLEIVSENAVGGGNFAVLGVYGYK